MGQKILYYEAARDYQPMEQFTTEDNQIYEGTTNVWSNYADDDNSYAPVIRPNGVVTGGKAKPAISGSNDVIDAASCTANLAGVLTSVVAATDLSITRAVLGTHRISSLTITSGGAYAIVTGTDTVGASAFVTTRGVDGGPPWIPTDSIEVAQIKTSTTGAAPIEAYEIEQKIGVSLEDANYPSVKMYPLGSPERTAYIELAAVLPSIHSDDAGSTTFGKEVWGETYEPSLIQIEYANEFKPPLNTFGVNSTPYYDGKARGSTSTTLNGGSFTVGHIDNITDPLVTLHGRIVTFKYKDDKLADPYILTQGLLGVDPTNPADGETSAACTISAETPGVFKAS